MQQLPAALVRLRMALEARLTEDEHAVNITMLDAVSQQRHARKLLHRLSQSLALALLCEVAGQAQSHGDLSSTHSAWRYYEEIEPPAFGAENEAARHEVLHALEREEP